jgi:hypothetical protein
VVRGRWIRHIDPAVLEEWMPPPADPSLIGDINRGYTTPERYVQPNTARPTLAELRLALARLWRRYRNARTKP